ncbi:ribonuclease H-like domain-containing protein, partial [Tanacetum coccineum]
MADQDTPPATITAMKIPIIKKGEYDIWSMRMRQYICHTDHNLWDIIVNGDLEDEATPSGEQSSPPVPKTAKQLAARRNQERIKSILLLAIPDEYLLKFHNVPDAKSLWAAIKSRFGGNEESKKMQKNVLKHQFENFVTASNETLDKAYDRFQKLISQLEIHGAYVSKEDINQKFLRSLPPSWSQIALIMRNKPDINEIDIDDLYNNLRVYKDEMKNSLTSSLNTQNLAFLSSENTNNTNEVSTANRDFRVSTAGVKKFIQRTGRLMDFKKNDHVYLSLDKSKIECYNCHRKGHFPRECRSGRNQGRRSYGDNGRRNAPTNESSSHALVAQDGLGDYDWSNDFEVEPVNYALMAISSLSSSSSSDSEVQKCSKHCLESFKTLQKNYDTEREKHNKAKLEIKGYEIALESLESRILGHEKNELAWKVVKERDELKLKIEKWEVSSKNLDELLNSQMSARDKTGLGYGTQLNEMSNNSETDNEISLSVFDVISSDEESTPVNDILSKADGYHVVPPPITWNFLTPRELTYHLQTVYESVNRDKVIIEDWNSDDEDDVSEVQTVSPVKTNESQTVKPRVDKIVQTFQKQGIGFKKIKVCFVCKSTDHLIKDCNFHDKKSQEPKLKNVVNTGVLTKTGLTILVKQNEKRAVHTVSTTRPVSTARPVKTARPVCTARPVSTVRPFTPKIAQTSGAIRPIYPRMDNVRPRGSYSPIKRSYYTKPAFRPKDLKQDVKTFGVQNMTTAGTRAVVNTGKGKMDTDLKKSRWVWRPKGNYLDHVSKDSGSFMLKKGNPEILLQDHAVVDSGCSSHMTGNKAYLSDMKITMEALWLLEVIPNEFNLFSASQMCDKKNSVLFTDTECLILSPSFKLLDENQLVLRAPRQNGVYSLDLKNIVPSGGITYLYANATTDESKLWHRRLGLENHMNHKVKIIRSDHGTKFKNHAMNVFCAKKGIKREFIVARTLQQNGVAERKNTTLIEAARTMLADSLLPIPFWAEAVNTACYVLNRVLVTKSQNKTPYELLIGKPLSISFMRPFGCPLTILNTLDPLGKFDGKSNEGYLLGYSTSSKAFRVYNKRTKRVEESLHIDFLEDQPNVAGNGPDWMFDLNFLTNTMNYIPVSIENQVTVDAVKYVVLDAKEKPFKNAPKDNHVQDSEDVAKKEEQHNLIEAEQALKDDLKKLVTQEMIAKAMDDATRQAFKEEKKNIASTKKVAQATSINKLNTGQIPIDASTLPNANLPTDPNMPDLEDDSDVFSNEGIFSGAYDDEDMGAEAYSTTWITPLMLVLFPHSEFKRIIQKKVWILIGLPYGKKAIGTKWVFRNKRGWKMLLILSQMMEYSIELMMMMKMWEDLQSADSNKREDLKGFFSTTSLKEPKTISQALKDESWVEAMQDELLQFKLQQVWILVDLPFGKKAIGTKQEEGIDYDEVFAPVARIEAIRLFLAFASYKGFLVYQMDVKSAFIYDKIEEEMYVHQPPGFVDPTHPNKVYKVVKALYGLHQAPRAWPDIMFAVYACARFQVTPKASHLHAVKRIFRYLKHQPKLGLWYPRDSPFELEAFSDSDYAGASLDRKSTTGGCSIFVEIISWQCKKQTIVANSTTEAEYVAAAHCCGQRLIDVLKIHTDSNVADLLTKGFDVTRISMDLRMDRCSPGKYYSSMVCGFTTTTPSSLTLSVHQGVHMANLKYSDKHNMIAFLKKPNESVGFTEVVDFLKGTSLRCSCGSRSYEAPLLEGNTSGSAEASMQLRELTVLVRPSYFGMGSHHGSKLMKGIARVELLFVIMFKFGSAQVDYVMIGKMVQGEEPKDQGRIIQDIDDDPLVSLVRESMKMKEKSTDFVTPT